LAEDDLPDVWEGATPDAERVSGAAPQPTPPRPPGPQPWLIVAGVLVLALLVAVLGLIVVRGMSASKSGRAQSGSAAALSASSAAAPAQAQSSASTATATPAQVAAQFGIIGVWANDCTQPTSQDNPYETYAATPQGALSDVINTGRGSADDYRWDTASLVGADQIALDGVHLGDGIVFQVIMQKTPDGRLHVLQSTNGSGQKLVVNGAFVNGGAPVPQVMCSRG
jgi:hypothetical protein